MSLKTFRTAFVLGVACLSIFSTILHYGFPMTSRIPQRVEGGVLRLRRIVMISDSTLGEYDILAIGGNALSRIETEEGKTIWKNNIGDEDEVNFLIGENVADERTDIVAIYGDPISVERINDSDGRTVDSHSELLNTSVWNLEPSLLDLDGVYPQEILIGTPFNLALMQSDFSEELWNVSFDHPRKKALYPIQSAKGSPMVGTWIEKSNNLTFMMLNGTNGDHLWNLSLPKEGRWLLNKDMGVAGRSSGLLLFFATNNNASVTENILLVQTNNGNVLWKKNFGSVWFKAVKGNFSGSDGLEFLMAGEMENGEPALVALNGTNGQQLWQEPRAVAKLTAANFTSDPVTDIAFVSERSIEVWDGATRERLWEPKQFGATIQAIYPIGGNNSRDPMVIIGLSDGKVFALNALTRETIWSNDELAENPIIEIAKSGIGTFEVIIGLSFVSSIALLRSRRRQSMFSRLSQVKESVSLRKQEASLF